MSTEYTPYVAELTGTNSNRQVALMAAAIGRSGIKDSVYLSSDILDDAEKYLKFLEETDS